MNIRIYSIFIVTLLTTTGISCANFSFYKERVKKRDPIYEAATRFRPLNPNRAPASVSATVSDSNTLEMPSNPTSIAASAISVAISEGEVTLGMSMEDVLSVWGYPRKIETAGLEELKNQKWVYLESHYSHSMLPTRPSRTVYFENGRVIGWEK